MKVSTKFMLGIIVVILVVILVYFSVDSILSERALKWLGKGQFILSISLALLIGSGIGYWISKTLSKNFTELKMTAEKISNGDLTHYSNVKTTGRFTDETADISRAINKMLDSLTELTRHISDTAMKVLQSSLNMYKLSDQVNESTNDIAGSFDYVNVGVAKQLDMIEQMLRTINDMASSSEVIAKYAREAEEFENRSNFNAQKGGKVVKETIEKLKNIFEKMERSTDQVVKFGHITERIGTIVEVISSIAKQTNILALNASIEASKAGEAGKGFSSVVTDIKSMSEDSKNAATQITELLQEVEIESNKAVISMKESSDEINEGRKMLTLTDSTLENIIDLVTEASRKVSKISALTDSHLVKTKEIVSYVNDVARLSEENKNATENIASTSEDQRLSIEEMSESAQQLYNLSEELTQHMSKFKIDGDREKG